MQKILKNRVVEGKKILFTKIKLLLSYLIIH